MKTKQEEILIGKVGVDSGCLMVGDPCYLDSDWNNEDYSKEVCSDWGLHKQLKGKNGYLKAVLFSAGFGDGVYNVYATIKDCGDWGKRVSEVRIKLIDEDDI